MDWAATSPFITMRVRIAGLSDSGGGLREAGAPGSQAILASEPGITWTGTVSADIPDPVVPHRATALGHGLVATPRRSTASVSMTDVTRNLSAIEQGDPKATEQLLPLVYDELRKLAAQKLAQEKPGQTLQAAALVHEAYLRLVDRDAAQGWDSRGHFFAAAAEAMRRILVENARRKAG